MPPKRNYILFFTTTTLAVEKKINQLGTYLKQLDPTAVSNIQERMLMVLTNKLQEVIDNLQSTWWNKRDKVTLANHNRVCTMVQETITNGEDALQGTEMFAVHVQHPGQGSQQGNGRPIPHPKLNPGVPPDKPDGLYNTLKPAGNLGWDMMQEEVEHWIKKFNEWFKWNRMVL